jgi:ribosomal protein S18 acetylase RimI-like enzyme
VTDEELAWRVEQACFNAWPALSQVHFGDWAARAGGGLSRRVNAANPLCAEPCGLERHLEEIVELYRRWGLRPRFRVPGLIAPRNDRLLEAAGFEIEAETLTLHAPLAALSRAADPEVEILPFPSQAWLEAKRRLNRLEPERADALARITAQLALPAGFAALRHDGEPAALAFGAIQHGIVCIEAVVTDERLRGRGLGRRLLGALLHWAERQGALAAALQVDAANVAGRALYAGLGFQTELYRYHYRSAPDA